MSTEHTVTPVDGHGRRVPRTFVNPQPDTTQTVPDPPTFLEDLAPELGGDRIDEPQERPDEVDNAAPMYAYEAVACQVFPGPDDDAFASTLILTGDNEEGDEVSVWMRLTPTLITRLNQQLTQVYRAQQEAMGLPGSDPLAGEQDDDEDNDDNDAEQESLIRRASDPLGFRFFRDRPASVKWLAVAICSLLVLSLILRAAVFR